MFCFTWHTCNSDFFLSENGINDTWFTDIWIPNQSDLYFFLIELFGIQFHEMDNFRNWKNLWWIDVFLNCSIVMGLQSGLRLVITFCLICFNLLHGWEENVVDSSFCQILVPHFYFLRVDQIALVDQKKRFLFRIDFFHVLVQIFASEK